MPAQLTYFDFGCLQSTGGTQNKDQAYHDFGALQSHGIAIILSPSSLPNADINEGYSQTITASGGTGPYTFATTAGTLPTGLTLTTGGVISGTITALGTFTFTITCTDANSNIGNVIYIVSINTGIVLAPNTLPNCQQSTAYSQTITATGGSGGYTYATTAGTIPTGLTLSTAGVLSGTPSGGGTFTFTITATDSVSGTTSLTYSILSYGKYAFSVTAGTLPTGLTLSSTGTVSGTPTTIGSYTFTVTAVDTFGSSDSHSYTINSTGKIAMGVIIYGNF
jgi:hypothetical protein